ncbi:amino acid permease [Nicoliella lavandulae]|uniref:Amino acid permease n=1 Tax=Nicoliella lavandulae TaxID=3082954 RepID=A0ABU8SLW6_9LACO
MANSNINKNSDGTYRSLSNRHVQMIAIGGTIGTGLFLGSGSTIAKTGPSVLLVYLVLGLFFFLMMRAIGEMFYSDPSHHTFVSFITKYLGPAAGRFTGWTYWIGLVFVCMAELTAVAAYVKFWLPNVPSWIVELVFLAILCGLNLIAARLFAETEFWFAMIKIIAIVSLIITGIFMMVKQSTTPLGHASLANITKGYQMFPNGSFNFISSFPMVFFAFQGIEFVSITIGEAKHPRQIIKKAVNETLLRILLFYIGALVVIMGIIPWRSLSPDVSPFVQIFELAGIPAAAALINFVVLTSAASALNSAIFSSGRHFYQIATEGREGSFLKEKFAKISKNGIPTPAILLSAGLVLITPIMSASAATGSVFTIVTGASSDMYILVYALTMLAHRKYRQSSDYLPSGFKMPWYKVTSPLTIAFFLVIFASLFFIKEDIIGAVAAIAWAIGFGGYVLITQKKLETNAN